METSWSYPHSKFLTRCLSLKEMLKAAVEILADHFYQGLQEKDGKKEELICEWNKFKYNPLNLQRRFFKR